MVVKMFQSWLNWPNQPLTEDITISGRTFKNTRKIEMSFELKNISSLRQRQLIFSCLAFFSALKDNWV